MIVFHLSIEPILFHQTFVLHAYIRSGQVQEHNRNAGIHQMLAKVISRGHRKMSNLKLQEFFGKSFADLNGFAEDTLLE